MHPFTKSSEADLGLITTDSVYVSSSKTKDTVSLKQPHRNVMTGGTPQNKRLNLRPGDSVTTSVGRLFHSLTTLTKKAESILKAWVGAL